MKARSISLAAALIGCMVPALSQGQAQAWPAIGEFFSRKSFRPPARTAAPPRTPPVGPRQPREMRNIGDVSALQGNPTQPKPPVPEQRRQDEVRAAPRSTWLERTVMDRLEITGYRTLAYRIHRVEGDRDAFENLNYFGQGGSRFQDTGQLRVKGRGVLGLFDFDVSFADNRFDDPEDRRFTINYDRGPIRSSFGDIRGSLLNSNPFALFNRRLQGAMVEYTSGRTRLKMLRSEAKGASRTVSFEGDNTVGPYFLQSGRIVADTVSVQIDGRPATLLTDYVVNGEIGTITFVDRIIPPTSTVIVTYESVGFGTPSGTIDGAGFTYDFGSAGRLGITGMQQTSGSSGIGGSTVERFFGFGSADAAYWLRFEPVAGSVQIRVDGLTQVQEVDYYFSPDSPFVFFFRRPVAPTQQIDVIYVPKRVTNTDGDRRVWGIDYRIPFGREGRSGFVQFSQATGELESASNPQRGTARGIGGEVRAGPLLFTGNVRDIPDGYVTIESRGFRRNESATDLGLRWELGKFAYVADYDNSSVLGRGTGGSSLRSRVVNLGGGIQFRDDNVGSWVLSHNRSQRSDVDETRLDVTELSGTRRWDRLDLTYGIANQQGRGPIRLSGQNETEVGDISLQSYRFGASYRPNDALSLSSRIGLSNVRALGESGSGRDFTFGVAYQPEGRWRIQASATDSDSGEISSLGFANGSGIGFGGNGFSGGPLGDGAFATTGSSLRSLTLSAEYQATSRLNLVARGVRSESRGVLSSNTRTVAYGLGFDLDLGNFTLLSGSIDAVNTDLRSDTPRSADSVSYDLSLSGAPKGRWSYRVGLSGLTSSGSSDFAQSLAALSLSVSYRLAPRQIVTASALSGRTTGLYGQDEINWGVFHRYQIYRSLALVTSYRFRDVKNLTSIGEGAYRSSGFDIELSFDFSQ
jgi:hypothetical protein